MRRDREAFFTGVSSYVPGMQFASHVSEDAPSWFSLGTPAASDDDIIDASVDSDAVAGTEESQDWTADTPYGRTLIVTPSADPGNAYAFDVHGYDYLMQPMVERFTGANGSTVVLYGKKAFYKVTKTKIVTAATNAITSKVGTGYALGLPYKGDVVQAKENGALAELFTRPKWEWVDIGATDGAAGCSKFVRAPFPGYVKTLKGVSDGAGGATDPVITVELGGTAITGLTVTVDTSASGNEVTDTPTTTGYRANNRFRSGDLIEVVAAAAAGAKGYRIGLELVPTQFTVPDTTDPATVSTGDPRGTYESIVTMDGAKEIIVALIGDNSVNTSDNGGLHGIQHYYA
jgi:hypothetical protein